jgi:hypothetical protein
MNPALKTVPESRILKNLEGLFPLKGPETVEQYLEELDALPGFSFPFRLTTVRVVNVELSVIDGIMRPSPRRGIVQFLTEIPEDPILITDIAREGKAALFFAVASADKDTAVRWLNRMNNVSLMVTFLQGDHLIAAPVSAFA